MENTAPFLNCTITVHLEINRDHRVPIVRLSGALPNKNKTVLVAELAAGQLKKESVLVSGFHGSSITEGAKQKQGVLFGKDL